MPTTTIRIEEALKERVAAAAERTGKTAHAFVVDVIAQSVDQLEMEDELRRLADTRWAKLLATGKSVPWERST